MIEIDINYVARLARLNLTPEESRLFQTQLAQVLEHAAKLREVNIEGIEPAAHPLPACNIFREDKVRGSLTAEEALSNAPHSADDLFIVTKVVE